MMCTRDAVSCCCSMHSDSGMLCGADGRVGRPENEREVRCGHVDDEKRLKDVRRKLCAIRIVLVTEYKGMCATKEHKCFGAGEVVNADLEAKGGKVSVKKTSPVALNKARPSPSEVKLLQVLNDV